MRRKKKKKKGLKGKMFNLTNMLMMVCSILVSYFVVGLSDSFGDSRAAESKKDSIASSAYRVALAFEHYNEKRF